METRYIGFIYDRNSFRRRTDYAPYGEAMYQPEAGMSIYRYSNSFSGWGGEWDFQKRRVYSDEIGGSDETKETNTKGT